MENGLQLRGTSCRDRFQPRIGKLLSMIVQEWRWWTNQKDCDVV